MSDWIPITERLPPMGEVVAFCCWIDDHFSDVEAGRYTGEKTMGEPIVMYPCWHCDDWTPCSHWMPLPKPPEVHAVPPPPDITKHQPIQDQRSDYGRCPWCAGHGISRERRPNGNDTCENGHVYPSSRSVK